MSVHVEINQLKTPAGPGESIFECAERLAVRVPTSCRKNGKCRECLVEVTVGMDLLTPRSPEESHLGGAFRLSCRARIAADEGLVACHTLRRGALQIASGGANLPGAATFRPEPAVTRAGDEIFRDGRLISRGRGPIHGLALDLGTTTCVLRLVDLETARPVATIAFENPQRFGGSDVMSRIQFDTDHGGRLLQRTLLGYLSHVIEELPVDPTTIHELVVAGNSTMRDLFFGLDVTPIGQRPYHSITQIERLAGMRTSTALVASARSLRLPVHPEARVLGLPILHGHVGADAAACLLAINLLEEDRLVALMDLGTNTELILGNRNRICVASCPAGPAFEGGAITCGMPALEGAVERVEIDSAGRPRFQVIGGGAPTGICGSGLVELLGELLRTGKMDSHGRLTDGSSEFRLDEVAQVRLTENDISELAQAKGANVAGLKILLRRYGATFEDLDVFYLAGGFGRHMEIDAARRIGLIPNLPIERIVKVGNASIEGATLALLSVPLREKLERAALAAEHVELETDPGFFDEFVAGCQFFPVDTDNLRRLE